VKTEAVAKPDAFLVPATCIGGAERRWIKSQIDHFPFQISHFKFQISHFPSFAQIR
jgi:hypothetical protein